MSEDEQQIFRTGDRVVFQIDNVGLVEESDPRKFVDAVASAGDYGIVSTLHHPEKDWYYVAVTTKTTPWRTLLAPVSDSMIAPA